MGFNRTHGYQITRTYNFQPYAYRFNNGVPNQVTLQAYPIKYWDQLLENGFNRYFWKSLFGTSLDGLALQAKVADGPAHLREVICGRRSKAEAPDAPSFAKITEPIKTADLPDILFSAAN